MISDTSQTSSDTALEEKFSPATSQRTQLGCYGVKFATSIIGGC